MSFKSFKLFIYVIYVTYVIYKLFAMLWSFPAGFLFSQKMTFLDIFDMYLMIFNIFDHHFVKIKRKLTEIDVN
jgi:hypothetical protein